MIRYNKYDKKLKTDLYLPIHTVDIYSYTGVLLNGKPFNKYEETLSFHDDIEFNEFLKNNNICVS